MSQRPSSNLFIGVTEADPDAPVEDSPHGNDVHVADEGLADERDDPWTFIGYVQIGHIPTMPAVLPPVVPPVAVHATSDVDMIGGLTPQLQTNTLGPDKQINDISPDTKIPNIGPPTDYDDFGQAGHLDDTVPGD